MKKLICFILVALVLIIEPVNVFASSLDRDVILSNSVTIDEIFEEGVGTWKISSLENTMIYSLEKPDGTLEYAYLDEDGVVQYTEIKEGIISMHSYDDDYFNTQEECLSAKEEALIDDIVIRNIDATSVELEKAFHEAGLYNVIVFEEDGGLFIDPFGAQNSMDSNSDVIMSAASYDIKLTGLAAAFPFMNKKQVGSRGFNAKPSPTVYTYMKCRDTRPSYTMVKKNTFSLKAGLSVVAAAAKVYVRPTEFKRIIGLGKSATSLVKSINFTRSVRAKSNVLRQACVYDRTNYKREVSVYTAYGTDYFGVYKASDSSPYGWGCEYQSLFDRVSISETLSEGIRIWQTNMDTYGYWKWGDV